MFDDNGELLNTAYGGATGFSRSFFWIPRTLLGAAKTFRRSSTEDLGALRHSMRPRRSQT